MSLVCLSGNGWSYIEGVCPWFVQVVMGGATLKGCVPGLSKW